MVMNLEGIKVLRVEVPPSCDDCAHGRDERTCPIVHGNGTGFTAGVNYDVECFRPRGVILIWDESEIR